MSDQGSGGGQPGQYGEPGENYETRIYHQPGGSGPTPEAGPYDTRPLGSGQPDPYGQGQYGQPEYGQTPYGQTPYGQGQYGQAQPDPYGQGQYGQGQYGQAQYGQGQYGQQGYGEPVYGQQPYGGGGQPPYGPPPGATGGKSGGNRGLLWAAGIVVLAGVVVLVLFATGVFSGGSSGAPADPVRALLNAGKSNDVNAAAKVLCAGDRAAGTLGRLSSNGEVTSYSIGSTSRTGDHARVTARVSTQRGGTTTTTFPVQRQGGTWKVCFTGAGTLPGIGGLPSGASLPSISIPSISIPSVSVPNISIPNISVPNLPGLPSGGVSGVNICSSQPTARGAAQAYVGTAEIGASALAQTCVNGSDVPLSTTQQLKGHLYAPTGSDSGPDFHFSTPSGSSTLTVRVEKKGSSYAVTNVTIG